MTNHLLFSPRRIPPDTNFLFLNIENPKNLNHNKVIDYEKN